MARCPICGAPRYGGKKGDLPDFLKRLGKLERQLNSYSPEEIARGLDPLTVPIALEAANFILARLKELVDAIKPTEE